MKFKTTRARLNEAIDGMVREALKEGRMPKPSVPSLVPRVVELFNGLLSESPFMVEQIVVNAAEGNGTAAQKNAMIAWGLANALHYQEWDFLNHGVEGGWMDYGSKQLGSLFLGALKKSRIWGLPVPWEGVLKEEKDWSWFPHSMSTERTEEAKQSLHRWIEKNYGELNTENYLRALRDTYRTYLMADRSLSPEKVDDYYRDFCERAERLLGREKIGIPHFERTCIGQGYFDWFLKMMGGNGKKRFNESYDQFSDGEGLSIFDNPNDLDERYGRLDGIFNLNNMKGDVHVKDYDGKISFEGEGFKIEGKEAEVLKEKIISLIDDEGFTTSDAISYAVTHYLYGLYGKRMRENKIKKNMKRRITESQLRAMVAESVKKVLKEDSEFDFYDFVDALEKAGWAYSGFNDVVLKDGRSATRYMLVKDKKGAIEYEALMGDLKKMFGDDIMFSTASHKYAPEITHPICYLVD